MAARISPAERRALKARAHALDPVVLSGDGGVTEAVLAEIERENFQVLTQRTSLTPLRKLWLAWKTWGAA